MMIWPFLWCMINAFQISWPAGNHVFTLQSHDCFPFSGYPYTVTLRFQPSLNSDPPGSALWFAPSRIVVYPIARAWLRGYSLVLCRVIFLARGGARGAIYFGLGSRFGLLVVPCSGWGYVPLFPLHHRRRIVGVLRGHWCFSRSCQSFGFRVWTYRGIAVRAFVGCGFESLSTVFHRFLILRCTQRSRPLRFGCSSLWSAGGGRGGFSRMPR